MITLEQIENSVRWAHEAGIPEIICSFILGHHADTHDSVQKTMHFAHEWDHVSKSWTRFLARLSK